jgi:hypothetical protein
MVKIIILHSCALELIYFFVLNNYVEDEFLFKILPFQHGCMEGGQQNIADFFLYDKSLNFADNFHTSWRREVIKMRQSAIFHQYLRHYGETVRKKLLSNSFITPTLCNFIYNFF